MGSLDGAYRLPAVLAWSADPVLLLFLGGFSLEVAAMRHGLDSAVARHVVRLSGGRPRLLLLLVMGGVAFLSMWMSNVAAAAMMLAALRPILQSTPEGTPLRPALLLSVALGANFGGMATPVGSGPNALAVSAANHYSHVTFAGWMALALPLTALMLVLGFGLILLRFRVGGRLALPAEAPRPLERSGRAVLWVSAACVVAWLSEPLHGVAAPVVALGATALLFGSGLLEREDLGKLDWSTLLLIAGGLSLGRLMEHSGLVARALAGADFSGWPVTAQLGVLVVVAAVLSALMSNTGTAALLIPLAMQLHPAASTPILVALGCSFGIPFVISPHAGRLPAGQPHGTPGPAPLRTAMRYPPGWDLYRGTGWRLGRSSGAARGLKGHCLRRESQRGGPHDVRDHYRVRDASVLAGSARCRPDERPCAPRPHRLPAGRTRQRAGRPVGPRVAAGGRRGGPHAAGLPGPRA
jgi:sodium-dependent dicarboxylate transporter 2/3/5